MKDIKVKEDDILWKLYVLYFTLKQIPLEQPKNLCNYFQTAVKGFLLFPVVRIHLSLLWTGLILFALMLKTGSDAYAWLVQESYPHWAIKSWDIVHGFIALAFMFCGFLTSFATIQHLDKWMKKHQNLTLIIFCPIVIIAGIFALIHDSKHGWKDSKELVPFVGIMFSSAIGLALLFSIGVRIWQKSSPERQKKVERLFSTIGAWLSARKRGICPLVEAPVDQVREPQNKTE